MTNVKVAIETANMKKGSMQLHSGGIEMWHFASFRAQEGTVRATIDVLFKCQGNYRHIIVTLLTTQPRKHLYRPSCWWVPRDHLQTRRGLSLGYPRLRNHRLDGLQFAVQLVLLLPEASRTFPFCQST